MKSPSSVCVIRKLKAHFAHHGIPEQMVTDNGLQFTSCDFLRFAKEWDFKHLTSSSTRSQGNGKAESAVKEAKKILRKCRSSGLDAFSFTRSSQHPLPSISVSSTEGREVSYQLHSQPQPVLDNELCRGKLERRKQRQAQYYNRGVVDLGPLKRGDTVRIKPFQLGKREWQKGIVQSRLDERSFEVETPQDVARRNRVHLGKTNEPSSPSSDGDPAEASIPCSLQSNEFPITVPGEVNPPSSSEENVSLSGPEVPSTAAKSPPKPVQRRYERQRRPPKHLSDFVLTKP